MTTLHDNRLKTSRKRNIADESNEDNPKSAMKRAKTRKAAESVSLVEDETPLIRPVKAEAQTSIESFRMKEIVGGEVYYMEDFVDKDTANAWLSELSKLDTWYHPKLRVYGKEVNQSRSIAAYAKDPNIVVKYSGHTVSLHFDYPNFLQEIEKRVEYLLGESFNHIMLNRYESGKEYIGKHRDTKENKIIVSVSVGAERTFIMTPNKPGPGILAHKWKLANGSLLVMRGSTQDLWKHEIPKEPSVKDERISLTFRQLRVPPP